MCDAEGPEGVRSSPLPCSPSSHFRTSWHNRWNGRSSLASGLCTERSGREATKCSGWERRAGRPGQDCRGRGATRPSPPPDGSRTTCSLPNREVLEPCHTEDRRIICRTGPTTQCEILPEFRAVTFRSTTLHKEPLTPGVVTKMNVRGLFRRFFEARDGGCYACLRVVRAARRPRSGHGWPQPPVRRPGCGRRPSAGPAAHASPRRLRPCVRARRLGTASERWRRCHPCRPPQGRRYRRTR
ncbi:hypothetical protein LFADAHJC_LOCUS2493 [Methylorubrum extorquens]